MNKFILICTHEKEIYLRKNDEHANMVYQLYPKGYIHNKKKDNGSKKKGQPLKK